MSKLCPTKHQKLISILESKGFFKVRQKGSHAFFRNSAGLTTVVPIYKGEEIGVGLLRKILNDTQIDPQEFRQSRL